MRNMYAAALPDAMVRQNGFSDLFITLRCNSKLKEIVENLKTLQSDKFRPDLVFRPKITTKSNINSALDNYRSIVY